VSCNKVDADGVPKFSYEEEKSVYSEDSPGVKQSGFNNTNKKAVLNSDDAIERAKNECTVEWNSTEVCYDASEGIWKVSFFNSSPGTISLGGDQSVYLSDDGKTLLVVYGE
jgi:hypothetical protein